MPDVEQKQPTCKQRWRAEKDGRIADLRKLWEAYEKDPDTEVEDLGTLNEYGLSFDYVAPGTFSDQDEGFWRYQLSCGGPQDEFRFYSSGAHDKPYRIEYWFLDWFDGHGRALVGEDLVLLTDLWRWFEEMGSTEAEYEKARED